MYSFWTNKVLPQPQLLPSYSTTQTSWRYGFQTPIILTSLRQKGLTLYRPPGDHFQQTLSTKYSVCLFYCCCLNLKIWGTWTHFQREFWKFARNFQRSTQTPLQNIYNRFVVFHHAWCVITWHSSENKLNKGLLLDIT